MRRLIDFNIAAGAKALMLTAGDSHYVALTEKEITEVTRVTVDHTDGRALVIAADRYYHTTQAVEFAHFAKKRRRGLADGHAARLGFVHHPAILGRTLPDPSPKSCR